MKPQKRKTTARFFAFLPRCKLEFTNHIRNVVVVLEVFRIQKRNTPPMPCWHGQRAIYKEVAPFCVKWCELWRKDESRKLRFDKVNYQ